MTCGVDLAALLGVEVPGFGDDQFGDPFAEHPGGQRLIGLGQVEPQVPGGAEAPRAGERRQVAGQGDLVGDTAADPFRVDIGGQLLPHLGLGEADVFGGLPGRDRGPQPLQPGDPDDPGRVADLAGGRRLGLRHGGAALAQHGVQPRHQRVRRNGVRRLDHPQHCHTETLRVTTDTYRTCIRRILCGKSSCHQRVAPGGPAA